MNKFSIGITYWLLVMFFAVLFKYGIQLSFDIDTGYVGPIFLWHALLVVSAIRGSRKHENNTLQR